MSTKEMTKKESAEISTEVLMPSFIDDDIRADKLIIPRLNLLQALSDAVQQDGQKQGTYNNSVTNENYGETVEVTPIKINYGAVYMTKADGLICKSVNGITNMHGDKCMECPYGVNYKQWTKTKEGEDAKPGCSETIDLICAEIPSMNPLAVTFRSSSYKEGQRLTTQLKMAKSASAVRLGSEKINGKKGTYFTPAVKAFNPLTPEQYAAASKLRESLKTVDYSVSEDNTGE